MQSMSRIGRIGVILLGGLMSLSSVAAPKDVELLEDIPSPPKVIEGQPLDKPAVTKRRDGDNEVEEYSLNGMVYMLKITPPNGRAYYLHREDRDGDWVNDGPTRPVSVPKWILFRF